MMPFLFVVLLMLGFFILAGLLAKGMEKIEAYHSDTYI